MYIHSGTDIDTKIVADHSIEERKEEDEDEGKKLNVSSFSFLLFFSSMTLIRVEDRNLSTRTPTYFLSSAHADEVKEDDDDGVP